MYSLVISTGRQAMEDLGVDPSQFDASTTPVRNYSTLRASMVAKSITDETMKQLRAAISQAIDAGTDVAGLTAVVSQVFGAALTYRSARIASTEAVHAQGFADTEAWAQSGLVEGKEWYTAEDEKVCAFCSSLDGMIRELDGYYFRMGDTITAGKQTMTVGFEDITTCPLHVSCRCYQLPVRVMP